jgi:hypothetical protein
MSATKTAYRFRSRAGASYIKRMLRTLASEFRARNVKGGAAFSDVFLRDAPRVIRFEASRLLALRASPDHRP